MHPILLRLVAVTATVLGCAGGAWASEGEAPRDIQYVDAAPAPRVQTAQQADAKSAGCRSCHTQTDHASMHVNPAIVLGCTDCHGGNASVHVAAGAQPKDPAYRTALDQAHVQPRYPEAWHYPSSAKPQDSYTLLNREAPEYVRFVNPSDYRVVRESCGACHLPVIEAAERSLMATGAMLWGGAAYNNGILPFKRYIAGESYTREGVPATVADPSGTPDPNMAAKGVLPKLFPLPPWEVIPPADIFRIFERGGRNISNLFPETGLPDSSGELQKLEEPGRPDFRQSNRGPGTGSRIAVPVINITKTRLNDPLMWFLGTNDQPGDYRSSGCAACHVVYANDRDPLHAGPYARFGNTGMSQSLDPTIPKNESGHPLSHSFTRAIPTSQCMVCHMHQPNIFLNSMLGYTMWDYESDAPKMWPEKQRYPTDHEIRQINEHNPEEAAIRGKWSDPDFLKNVSTLNPQLKDTQFADYHGHGWNFRAIFKRDRKGDLLDKDGKIVADDDPHKFDKSNPHAAVQLMSIHVEKGMQCADCHFGQDAHSNGHIYGEVAQAIEIDCQDCHGTVDRYPSLRTSGPAAPAPQCPAGWQLQPGAPLTVGNAPPPALPTYDCVDAAGNRSPAPAAGNDLADMRTQDGRRRFEWINGELWQRSGVTPGLEWRVHLVKDSVTLGNKDYNPKAARAKLMSTDTASFAWGSGVAPANRAHQDSKMLCVTCHSSWTTSCFGCHLPIQANWKTERHHFEGGESRNYATYNPQVVRDDFYMLGKHGEAKGYRIAPVRSTSALVLSSTNSNREHIYVQQPPVSAGGYSSQAFAPHYPHTERTVETKTCTDCHVSKANDNNAVVAQLLGLGTGFVNFVGYHAYVGLEGSLAAVQVTEWDEPQAVIGSYLHRYAYPDWYKAHVDRGRELKTAHTHGTGGPVGCLQLRGEYLYAAQGSNGMQVYDVSAIGNKGVSEKIITAPFSPLGHDTHITSKDASCVALPTDQPISPLRNAQPMMRTVNKEQPFHEIYHYALITDRVEGLILTNVDTMQDGEPRNNFLTRALTYDAGGLLKGARHLAIAGDWVYVSADAGIVVLNLADPLKPRVAATIPLKDVRATAVQFRYLFATTGAGLQVVDITHPEAPHVVAGALVPLKDARRVYLARTYAYVAAGAEGLAIVDVEHPEQPRLYQAYTADGRIGDAYDVIVGSTNASLFAYVADGKNGLHVIQLTAPDTQPKFYGFSPAPKPQWIAHYATSDPALSLSRGLDRDRAVDETGGQIAVFGRIGSRPFNLEEMQKLYMNSDGSAWFVSDHDDAQDRAATAAPAATPADTAKSSGASGSP